MKPRKPIPSGQPPRRKKPLKRGKAPTRSPLVRKVVNRIKAKGKPRFSKGRDPQYLKWIRGLPCVVKGRMFTRKIFDGEITVTARHVCGGRIEAAHFKSRGAGGADQGNCLPLCTVAHQGQHSVGIQTWAEGFFGSVTELRRIAAEVYPAQWLKQKELGWPE